MASPKKEWSSKKGTKGEGLKDLTTTRQEHARPDSIGLKGYWSIVDKEDLSLIHVGYCILEDHALELPSLDS